MIDSSKKRNHQLAFELQNSHVCEKHSKNKNNKLTSIPVERWVQLFQLKILFERFFIPRQLT